MWNRIVLLRAGLRSSLGRYSRDVWRQPPRIDSGETQRDALQRELGMTLGRWSDVPHETFAHAWAAAPSGAGLSAVAWLGHCTVLMKIAGKTVLTDPVLSPKIGVRLGPVMIGPRRLSPSIAVEHLPVADVLLISHAHFDHLDRPTLRRLANAKTQVLTAQHTRAFIPRGFASVQEVPWGEQAEIAGIAFQSWKPRHWGARKAWDRHRGYNSYLLTAGGSRVLFAGDTAYTDQFAGTSPIDLAIMGIAAYDPWIHAHATPEQVVAMATQCRAARLLPVHHSTYRLSDEPIHEPMERLKRAIGGQAIELIEAPVGRIVTF